MSDKDDFLFTVEGFQKVGWSFVVLGGICLATTWGGFMFTIGFVAVIFVLFLNLYKFRIYRNCSKYVLLKLSGKIGKILSFVPNTSFNGTWFMEQNSEKKELKSVYQLIRFLVDHWVDFILIHTAIVAFFYQMRQYISPREIDGSYESVLDFILADPNDFTVLYVIMLLPIFMSLYFTTVWVWEDAEIKIAKWTISSKGDATEISELILASRSLRNLITFFVGFNTILWIIDLDAEISGSSDYISRIGTIIIIFLAIFGTSGGITVLMGVMYYRSGVHEYLVNELRLFIRDKYLSKIKNQQISICKSNIIQIDNL